MKLVMVLLLLAGCASQPAPLPPSPPQPPAPQVDLAAIKSLLQPCHIEVARKYTTSEATRVANARLDALIQCNKDKAAALDKLEHRQ